MKTVLVFVALAPWAAWSSDVTTTVERAIAREARAQSVPVSLALAIAEQESGFRQKVPDNTSAGKGACVGVFQILEETALRFCGINAQQLRQTLPNIRCGIKFIRSKLDAYVSQEHAIASYNSGAPVLCATRKQKAKYNCTIGELINQDYVRSVNLRIKKWKQND
jgi:soluble lytic murein transglycosylase-like protein